jgi:GWxTD domain-containing protein
MTRPRLGMDVTAAFKTLGVIGLACLTAAGQSRQSAPDALTVNAVRFYRADAKRTQVKVFVQIPAMLMASPDEKPDAKMTYLMAVRVRDSTGLELVHDSWAGHFPASLREPGATTLEILEYTVAPGKYTLDVDVSDSITGKKVQSETLVEGFGNEPGLSDLLLAPMIRQVGPSDTLLAPGEIRRGDLLITGAAELRLTPLRSNAYYMIEAYSAAEDSVSLGIGVTDSSGKTVVSTPPRRARLPAGGGVLSGAVPLAGLPAGQYRMTAKFTSSKGTVERTARFIMAALDQTLVRDTAERTANLITDEGYFASLNDAQLDAAAEPLSLIASGSERSAYKKNLSLRAKRRFLTDFWAQRDPSPGTPVNETRQLFYYAIAYADTNFRERGSNTLPGWKTDRGRIFAKHGKPDDILRRQQQGYAPPYEVWHYSRGKGAYYIFADRSGVGNFKLMSSNDVKELGDPNWTRVLGVPALEDIAEYLNLDRIELDRVGGF